MRPAGRSGVRWDRGRPRPQYLVCGYTAAWHRASPVGQGSRVELRACDPRAEGDFESKLSDRSFSQRWLAAWGRIDTVMAEP